MKLVRNAVFAVKAPHHNEFNAILYVNAHGNLSPAWRSDVYQDGWSRHGELSECLPSDPQDEGHNHWYGIDKDDYDIVMIQSHVTKASEVDLRAAKKFMKSH